MKVTAQDLHRLGVIDTIVREPVGGAHRDPAAAIGGLKTAIGDALAELSPLTRDELQKRRRARFLEMGNF
jgi:acetyl-CoA carboxylase carboxyl transferase subunit alpha